MASGGKEAPYISIVIYPSREKPPAALNRATHNKFSRTKFYYFILRVFELIPSLQVLDDIPRLEEDVREQSSSTCCIS